MAKRFDISDKVIHFTKGESQDGAFDRLRAIIGERRLIGSSPMVRGGYRCVSFTEAPIGAFVDDFVRQFPFNRYSQFGLMFPKSWVYDREMVVESYAAAIERQIAELWREPFLWHIAPLAVTVFDCPVACRNY